MFQVEWDVEKGWGTPRICQLHNLSLHPAAKVLHYAQEVSLDVDLILNTINTI